MKQIGLFFGSFNPIHIGHLILARTALNETDLEQIWFVVSPQNPFKKKKNLLSEYDRLRMVEEAIWDDDQLRASNVEFSLPKPVTANDSLTELAIPLFFRAVTRFSHILYAISVSRSPC